MVEAWRRALAVRTDARWGRTVEAGGYGGGLVEDRFRHPCMHPWRFSEMVEMGGLVEVWWRLVEVWWRVVEMVEMVEHGGGSAVTPPPQNETDRFPNSNFKTVRGDEHVRVAG